MIQIIAYLRHVKLSRFISILLAAIILFAEAGQVIYAHTCFKSNETSYSLYTPAHCKEEAEVVKKSCCSKAQKSEKKDACTLGKSDCCGVFSKYVKGDLQSSQPDFKMPDVPKDFLCEQPLIVLPILENEARTSQSAADIELPPNNTSPAFICVFRC